MLRQKANSNFAANLAEMLKEATIHFCLSDESHLYKHLYTVSFQTSVLFDMQQQNV